MKTHIVPTVIEEVSTLTGCQLPEPVLDIHLHTILRSTPGQIYCSPLFTLVMTLITTFRTGQYRTKDEGRRLGKDEDEDQDRTRTRRRTKTSQGRG